MSIIKLNAIDSTNVFLKDLSRKQILNNFTTVVAENQTNGKGQMGSKWDSEMSKNLTMSVLIKDVLVDVNQIFHLNVAISLAVFEVLNSFNLPKLSIKWPNDIMSDNKKIAGILIENSFKSDSKIESIVGVGLNINQAKFDNLPKATSMFVVMNKEFDKDLILDKILFQIKRKCLLILSDQTELLWKDFHEALFKINIPVAFEGVKKNMFMGIVKGVSFDGRLEVQLEDDSIHYFGIKEVKMLF